MSIPVADLADLLAAQGLAPGNGATLDLDDEGELCIENNIGTDDDRAFDAAIGAIEGVLMSEQFQTARAEFLAALPPIADVDDHERVRQHRRFVEHIDALVDACVAQALPGRNLEELALLIHAREAEVSDDVKDLVSGGEGMDLESFVALWEHHQAKPKA
jgi:hypothetical protein